MEESRGKNPFPTIELNHHHLYLVKSAFKVQCPILPYHLFPLLFFFLFLTPLLVTFWRPLVATRGASAHYAPPKIRHCYVPNYPGVLYTVVSDRSNFITDRLSLTTLTKTAIWYFIINSIWIITVDINYIATYCGISLLLVFDVFKTC